MAVSKRGSGGVAQEGAQATCEHQERTCGSSPCHSGCGMRVCECVGESTGLGEDRCARRRGGCIWVCPGP